MLFPPAPESSLRLQIVSREETWRLHWSETLQTELERHDQECFSSPRGRTGWMGRYCQSPVPVSLKISLFTKIHALLLSSRSAHSWFTLVSGRTRAMPCLPSRNSRDQLAFRAALGITLQRSKLQAYPWNQTLVPICFYLANRAQLRRRKNKLEKWWQGRVLILQDVTVSGPQTGFVCFFFPVNCKRRLLKAIS